MWNHVYDLKEYTNNLKKLYISSLVGSQGQPEINILADNAIKTTKIVEEDYGWSAWLIYDQYGIDRDYFCCVNAVKFFKIIWCVSGNYLNLQFYI